MAKLSSDGRKAIRAITMVYAFVLLFAFFMIFPFIASPVQKITESDNTVDVTGSAYFILTLTYIEDAFYEIEVHTDKSFVISYSDDQGEPVRFRVDLVDSNDAVASAFEYSSSGFMALGTISYHDSGSITFAFTRLAGSDDAELFIETEDFGTVDYAWIYFIAALIALGLVLLAFVLTKSARVHGSGLGDEASSSLTVLQKALVTLGSLFVPIAGFVLLLKYGNDPNDIRSRQIGRCAGIGLCIDYAIMIFGMVMTMVRA